MNTSRYPVLKFRRGCQKEKSGTWMPVAALIMNMSSANACNYTQVDDTLLSNRKMQYLQLFTLVLVLVGEDQNLN